MKTHNVKQYQDRARSLRRRLFEKFVEVKQGHPGSVFSMVDVVTALYYADYIRKDPSDPSRMYDKLVVSKGHGTASVYPILVDLGIIPKREWDNWGKSESVLRVFGNTSIPGIDVASGSLGHGLGLAAGMALSYRRRGIDKRVYVVISEGELYEGSCWEAFLFIAHHKLDNIHIVLDRNNLMILGDTEDCVRLDPIKDKIAGFGFGVTECDGHDFPSLFGAFDAMLAPGGPRVLIAQTVKGKGFSLMERKAHWHYWNPLTPEQIADCLKEVQ